VKWSDAQVTVVIPTIEGREELLRRAVDSATSQTHKHGYVLIQLDSNREGAATTRNRALAQVQTEFVAWLDDDDELLPRHLEVCLQALLDHRADLAYPGMIAIGGRDPLAWGRDPLACPIHGVLVNPFGVEFGPEQAHHLRTVGNFIPITWVGRTDVIRRVGGFPQPTPDDSKGSGRIEEDYGLLLKLLDVGARFVHVPERTWKYYFHESNTGGRGEGQI
jgi:glycosyltransferase involved in cell wall biosynthesis